MYTSLGTSEQGEKWPTLEDGSKMRFVPMFVGEIESDEVYEKIADAMRMQATTKAGELRLDLKLTDLYEKKQYLGGRTMEDIIHSATSEDDVDSGMPIFKHIASKWMSDDKNIEYQVIV